MNLKKLYLDICTLCRPFDDQNLMRIRLETDAYYLILDRIQNRSYQLIASPVHFEEIACIDEFKERIQLLELLSLNAFQPAYNKVSIMKRAEELISLKFGVADAAHFAFAEASSDYFITCDDKLIKRARRIAVNIKITNPIEFCIIEKIV